MPARYPEGLTAAALLAACLVVFPPHAGADAVESVATAIRHARLAAEGDSTDAVHRHLQHAINCLEGSNGRHFDAAAGHPCEGMGNGALNDIPEMLHRYRAIVSQARDLALMGTAIDFLTPAQHTAEAVAELLAESQEM